MGMKTILTQELAKEMFKYDMGLLYWKVNRLIVRPGELAGTLNSCGYRQVGFSGKIYLQHRVIFLMFKGYLPKYIDHINGNRSDNRIENLREATSSQNNHNRKRIKTSKYPAKGIYQHSRYKDRFCVEIYNQGKRIHLGIFKTLEEAVNASTEARKKYHKDFANNG